VHPPGLFNCPTCGGTLRDAAVPLHVHGLVVERRIGAGGMGVVYGATDLALRRQVAVKTLPTVSMGHSRQLRREARAMAALSHPNLATIYAVDVWHGTPLLFVEYLQGGTLQDAVRGGPLAIHRVLDIGTILAGALAHMHHHAILHRDLKPSNIGFTGDGVPKLLDFGLAKIVIAAVDSNGIDQTTSTGGGVPPPDSGALLIGTPAYFSPELAALKPPDYLSDVWALALSLYEAIAGVNPFAAPTPLETLDRVAKMPLPRLDDLRPGCPPEVSDCFARALSRDRTERPPTARAFKEMLQAAESARP
jgi:serine/threonine-protein kinase